MTNLTTANADGHTINDIVIAAHCKSLQVRSERKGDSNGRVYVVTLKVTDTSGNVTTATPKSASLILKRLARRG